MKKTLFILFSCLAFSLAAMSQNIIYVNVNVSGGDNNGTSWANAYNNLTTALGNASSGKEVWVAKGTYRTEFFSSFEMKGGVAIYGGFVGGEAYLAQRNYSNNLTELAGDIFGVIKNIDNGLTLTAILDGFTVAGFSGGGITNKNVSPTIRNCVFMNFFDYGISNLNSSPTMVNCVFDSNEVGIHNDNSSPTIIDCLVKGSGLNGLSNTNSSPTIVNSIFQWSGFDGIHNSSNSSPTITNCIFFENKGNGMANDNSSPTIIGCLFTKNYQSGIYNRSSSSPTMINTTIAGNTGNSLFNDNSTTLVKNSVVWGSIYGNYTASHSLIKDKTDTNNGNIDATPYTENDVFRNFAGGDYALKVGSPAINVGNNSFYTGLSVSTSDLSNNPRVYAYTTSGVIDIGAYEYQGLNIAPDANNILYVNNAVTGGNGVGNSWANALKNLADALKYAKQQQTANNSIYNTTPLKIYVAKGTYKPLYSPASGNFGVNAGRDNAFLLVPNVAIYGGFVGGETSLGERNWRTNQTILSGDIDSNDGLTNGISTTINGNNSHHVVLSGGDMGSSILDGFTVTGGQANGSGELWVTSGLNNFSQNFSRTDAAGIFNRESGGDFPAPTISNCRISGNHANNLGGGLANYNSSPSIINCIISGNTAGSVGGGMRNSGNAATKLTGTLIYGNTAPSGAGVSNHSSGTVVFTNSTIAANGSSAVDLGNAWPHFNNSIIWDNVAGSYHAKNSLIKDKTDASNGNINANGLTDNDIFTNYAANDYTLKSKSPAINVGNNSYYTGLDVNTVDLFNNPRVYNYVASGIIDMGAYEYQGLNIAPDASNILYVNGDVTGGNSLGNSWTNAIKNLADALKYAKLQQMSNNTIYNTTPLKIYVAKGTYKPLYSPGSSNFGVNAGRDNAFLLVPNVAIYGGFTGSEPAFEQRNWRNNQTILSGDIDNNDVVSNGISNTINGDNVYHIVLSGGDMGSSILDGFTVTGGQANGSGELTITSGLNNFSQNFSRTDGAGIFNRDSNGSFPAPTILNCRISGNYASNLGGGVANYNSSPTIVACNISGNTAGSNAGGMRNSGNAATKVLGTLIYGNTALMGAGVSNHSSGTVVFTNSTIVANGSNGVDQSNAWPHFNNSLVWDTFAGSYHAKNSLIKDKTDVSDGNISAGGLTENDIFTNYAAKDYTLKVGAPVINKGDYVLYTNVMGLLDANNDLAGNIRLFDGKIDIGAYESQVAVPLPVSFGRFTATLQNNRVKLDWNTFSERNNEFFIVYRSTDGLNYTEIARQFSKSNNANSYIAYDNNPVNGVNYYHLKQKDFDGTVAKLGDVAINFSLRNEEVKAWPNPVVGRLQLSFTAGKYESLRLVDISGKKLQMHSLTNLHEGLILEMGSYPKGVYLVELKGEGVSHLIKVLK